MPYTTGTRYEVIRHCPDCDDWMVWDKYTDSVVPGLLSTHEEIGEVADELEAAHARG
jgi:hypothetical protein